MTYQISVDGYGGASGNISLGVQASASVSPRRDRAGRCTQRPVLWSVPGTGVTSLEAIDAVFSGHLRICQAPGNARCRMHGQVAGYTSE